MNNTKYNSSFYLKKLGDFSQSIGLYNTETDVLSLFLSEAESILPSFRASLFKFKNKDDEGEVLELNSKLINKNNTYNSEIETFKELLSKENTATTSITDKSILLFKFIFDEKQFVICILEFKDENETDKTTYSYLDTLTKIVSNQLNKIHEYKKFTNIKEKLESLVDEKTSDVDRLLNQFSEQYSKLKLSYEKRDLLLQEVHHRVNNNLQIISSILNIYQSEVNIEETSILKELHKRIQALALLHQNFYKSFEKSLIDFKCYLRDLLNYISSYSGNKNIQFSIDTDVKFMPFDTLVPLGLLITEMTSSFILNDEEYASKHPLTYSLASNNGDGYTFSINNYKEYAYTSKDQNFNFDPVQEILVDAYMDQLNASEVAPKSESELFCIKF